MSKKPALSTEDEQRIKRILAEVEARLRKSFAEPDGTLLEIETEVTEIGKTITERITQEKIDKIASAPYGSRSACRCYEAGFPELEPCHRMAKLAGRSQSRQVITLHGQITFARSYFYCANCKHGFCPADIALGIAKRETSRAVQAHACRMSCYLPPKKAAVELFELTGIKLSASSIDRFSKSAGRSIAEEHDALRKQLSSGDVVVAPFGGRRFYVSMDAFKAHVGGVWRDAKLGVVYSRNAKGRVDERSYYASFECSADFGPQVLALARRFGITATDVLEALGDGAEWIWNEFTKAFPQAVQVLDYYHLMDKLATFAKARFGADAGVRTPDHSDNDKKVAAWLRLQHTNLLDHGDPKRVTKDIQGWQPTGKGDQEIKRTTLCYLQEHRARTNYKELREGGFDIGSGIMESGCKTMKARLGGPGMRWEEPGAASMLHLTSLFHASAKPDFIRYTHSINGRMP